MVTEKYVPYKGVFGSSAVIETTLNWFNNSSELCFLWVYPDGKSDFKTMGAATRAGKVVVSGNRVKISSLTNGETTSESVFVYRASSVKTQAYQVSEGVIPLSSIINELEELRRFSEDVKAEVAKSIRVPEWDGETHFTDKDSRAGKVMGFDKDGNPTTGEDCKQVKDLFEAGKAAQESASSAAAQAQEAKRQADIAGTHASDCNDSVAECSDLLKESELEANKAKTYYEKTASVGADAVNKATVAANRAVDAKDAAVSAKDAVLAAKEDVAAKTQELDKAVCYIACAASEVDGRVETAKQELTEKAEQTKQEIAGFTDVYKKSETYSKAEIDGVDTGAELTAAMNHAHEQLMALRGEIPDNFYEMLLSLLEGWSQVPTATWQACWDELMEAVRLWRENPTEEVLFGATDKPYESKNGVVVDFRQIRRSRFSETELGNATGYSMFASAFSGVVILTTDAVPSLLMNSGGGSVSMYAPNTIQLDFAFTRRYGQAGQGVYRIYAPKATSTRYAFYVNYDAKEIYVDFRNSVSGYGVFFACTNLTKVEGRFDSYRIFDSSFCSGNKKLTHARIYAPSLYSASGAFKNSGLDAESICYTLDNLSADPVGRGGNGIITFTGCPGASELTQESPSVAAAVAKGWTVEL